MNSKMLSGKHFFSMSSLANPIIGTNFSNSGCMACCLAAAYPLNALNLNFISIVEAKRMIFNSLVRHRNAYVSKANMIKSCSDAEKLRFLIVNERISNDSKNREVLRAVLNTKMIKIFGKGKPLHFILLLDDGTIFDPALSFFINNRKSLEDFYSSGGRKFYGIREFPYFSITERKI